jgi:prepilin-type N-terminal cleavage/methylation domain-containing protein
MIRCHYLSASTKGMFSMRKAFTLIELLVVIAIIAILAAILFPVFAQAKLAAKKTQALSNTKQIDLGFLMYTNDYDDNSPKLGGCQIMSDGQYHGIDYTDQVYPYTKNVELFFDPVRNDYDSSTYSYLKTDEPGSRYVGFGYNWGPILRRGGGLLDRQIADPNFPSGASGCVGSTSSTEIPGINLSQVQTPADMFSYAASYDTPRITMGADFLLCTFRGSKQSDLRYNGILPVSFVDGHSKSTQFKWGFGDNAAEHNQFAVPSNLSMITDWCADPSFVLDSTTAGGSPDGDWIPDGTLCSALPGLFAQLPSGAYNASGSTPTFVSN